MLGHLGEGLPYWLFRIDFMHGASVRSGRYASQPKLERKASDYLRENFYYTTSGMAWTPPIRYVQDVMGMDRVMYAMDYPYQFVPEEVNVTDELPIAVRGPQGVLSDERGARVQALAFAPRQGVQA